MKANQTVSDVSSLNQNHDLIEACKRGDQKAQFQIYRLYYKAMYRISLRIVQNPVDAEDIMQESFLSAFENINSWSGKVSFGAWLKKIVHNRSIDYLKKSSRYTFEDIGMMEGAKAVFQDDLLADEVPDIRLKRVMSAIRELPSKWREIISLYFFEGYDHDEISEILSISPSTSRSNISRARQKIIEIVFG